MDIVDEVIYAIRHCGGGQPEAKAAIMEQFGFDEPQAEAICKFPLGRLAGLEIKRSKTNWTSCTAGSPNGRPFWPTTPGCAPL